MHKGKPVPGTPSTTNPTWTGLRLNPGLRGVKQATNRLSHCSCCFRVLPLFPPHSLQPNLSLCSPTSADAQTVVTRLAQFPVLCSSVVTGTIVFAFAGTTQPRVRERTAPVWICPNAAAKSGRQASLRHFLAVLALG